MTVVVAFLCEDGVVVAADSMLTPNFAGLSVGHHNGRKVYILDGNQVFAYAGDHGQAARVRANVNELHPISNITPNGTLTPLDYSIEITKKSVEQFRDTGLDKEQIEVNGVLAFHLNDGFHCCVFEGMFQPRLLDADHYYAAFGTGKLSADPFLRFLTDIFCPKIRPNVSQATFLAAWVVNHVIETNPGGVAGPIQISILEMRENNPLARELEQENEIQEHLQAIDSAGDALRSWHSSVQTGAAAGNVPEKPVPPSNTGE